jgi:hypothetical protein
MKPLRTLLAWLLLCCPALAADVLFYVGTSGQTLYTRVDEAGTLNAQALTEGTSGRLGRYYASEANLVSAGVDTASSGSGFSFTVHSGSPSTTATDTIVAYGYLPWSGSAEIVATVRAQNTSGDAIPSTTDMAELQDAVELTPAGVWALLTADLDGVGSIGKLIVDYLDAPVSEAGGGGTPAQVHNTPPVKAFTAKLGTRADGVIRAYPTLKLTATNEAHIWIDCSNLLSTNIENVTDGESDDTDVATVEDLGMYEKYVSIVLDTSGATVGDTVTITCEVENIGPVAVDVVVKAP